MTGPILWIEPFRLPERPGHFDGVLHMVVLQPSSIEIPTN